MLKRCLALVLPLALLTMLLIALSGPMAQADVSLAEDISVPAAVRCVNPGGTGSCYASVQAAVDAAETGDEIWVATGFYTGVQGRPAPLEYEGPVVITQVVYISKTVTVRGGYSPGFTETNPISYPTTLDAQGQGRVMVVAGEISPTVEGLQITGGNASHLRGIINIDTGGGIYIYTATTTISSCEIYNNIGSTATWGYGGGLFVGRSTVVLINNVVQNNNGSTVAGSAGGGLHFNSSTVTLTGNIVFSNTASTADWGMGGGLFIDTGTATLTSNTVQSNTASTVGWGYGGGLYLYQSPATLISNAIVNNTASLSLNGKGGGVYLYHSAATLAGNTVYENAASVASEGDGGGYTSNVAPPC